MAFIKYIYALMKENELTKDEVVLYLKNTNKQIKYTHGLGYRRPTIHNEPISKEKAIDIFKTHSLCDVKEFDDYVHVNTYSGNDMW